MTKRCIAFLLAILMICVCMSACSTNTGSNTQIITDSPAHIAEDTTSFKLSYSQADSLNPFKSKTLNNQIMQNLVYESLFTLDEEYMAQPCIAMGYSYTDTRTLVVTIASGHTFSDGSQVTAQDIVQSFNQAQLSPHWKNSLAPIGSAVVTNPTTITFNLNYENANAQNLLTFAITKAQPDEKGFYIGSGRYKLAEDNGGVCLVKNPEKKDFLPRFTKISLINVATSESIDNAVNIGNITYAFRDMAQGGNTRITCNKKMVALNNLVFIGINGHVGITSNKSIRQAISLAINRDTLVKSAYQGYAKPATSVFNPASKEGKQTALFSAESDVAAAKQAIAQSGYGKNALELNILVSKNQNKLAMATLVKQQLEAVGFKVKITSIEFANYKEYVKAHFFDIYIGETKIPDDMRLTSFFGKDGATSHGIDQANSKATTAYKKYAKGEGELGKFLLEFADEMPFIPVLYRQGMVCYSKSLHGDIQAYTGNYFSNIQDWYC